MPPETMATVATFFSGAKEDVTRMERDTNDARFDALTSMLAERHIAFDVEPFTIEPRKGEPRTQGRNVVVAVPGRSPEIVIGAHYDAARLPDGTLSKGAVDNAASTAILARLAEALPKMRLRTQTRIVFFDMEELGLLGSAEFVRVHRDRSMRAMVNLDVNAFGDAVMIGPRTASNGFALDSLRASCVEIATACVEFPRMPPSDDISFQKGGVPAVSMATVPAVQVHQLWLLLNGGKDSGLQPGFLPRIFATIHTTADTSAVVDRDAMARAYRITVSLVATLSAQ
jgi:Zn-dependent M28 family amino/carboxypeptidase